MVKLREVLMAATIAFPAASVLAQTSSSEPSYLDKTAVERLVIGHKLMFVRSDDKNKITWAVDKNGILYGENLSLGSKDSARWSLTDKGELCVKWKGNSKDGCRLFTVTDGTTLMFDTTSPTLINATIEKIE